MPVTLCALFISSHSCYLSHYLYCFKEVITDYRTDNSLPGNPEVHICIVLIVMSSKGDVMVQYA